ncbi:hypothetical protein Lesp01_17190 [Lentzea sp. NBRC 102530]|nr:hypothetical protein Lesp01_17190 [Lentzea sp. NBRC 102530]
MGVVGVGAPLTSAAGIRWNVWVLLGCTVAIAVVVLVVQRFARNPLTQPAWSRTGSLTVAAGVVAAGGIATLTLLRGTYGLDSVPQGWDAPYHGNGIRFIAETGNAGNRAFGWIDVPDNPAGAFYPNAYHAFESIIYKLTGVTIPLVMNTGMVVTAALVVPLGTVALVKAFGGRAGFAAASALVSTSFAAYPFDLWQWGQLYPYVAGLSLILPFLALFVRWLDARADRLGVLVAVVAVGLAAVHSAMMFVAVLLVLCYLVQRAWPAPREFLRRDLPRLGLLTVGAAVIAIPYLIGASTMAGRTSAYNWPAVTTPSRAFGDAVLLGHEAEAPQYLLAALSLFGFYLMLREPVWRWALGAYVVFLGLFVAADSVDAAWATAITSPWWNDRWRLVAVLVLPATLAAGWALNHLVKLVEPRGQVVLLVVAALVAGGYLVVTHGYVGRNAIRLHWTFRSTVVTDQERQGLLELGKIVKPGERVMNDGVDGTVWMYALSGAEPIVGHYPNPATMSPRRKLLLDRFNQITTDSAAAQVVRDLNIRYAVVSSGLMADFRRSPGMVDLDDVAALKAVYRNRDFQLYEVDWSRLAR